MRVLGFSTGAIAKGNFRTAVDVLREFNLSAIELSALRENELDPLLDGLQGLDISQYKYVSVHAPSALNHLTEKHVTARLATIRQRGWPIIVHPDVITDFSLWQSFEEILCIENMDKRKPVGRTVSELDAIFRRLPRASFCFDIGHARQVDPTMNEAALILREFRSRLTQVHISEVTSLSRHEGISLTALSSFRKVARLIPKEVPVILEPVIAINQIRAQLFLADQALTQNPTNYLQSNGHHKAETSAFAK